MQSPHAKALVLLTYSRHPLQESTILSRVLASRGSLKGLTEADLSVDARTEVTDQNHVGGIEFVKELGRRARVDAQTSVLDLGAGLGGPARVLACTFGCKVLGIELSPKRCREGQRLTRLVGLSGLVRLRCSDFMTARVPPNSVDVLWGQNTWLHVAEQRRFVRRWIRVLKKGGRVALEDAFLSRAVLTPLTRRYVRLLEKQWLAYLVPADTWRDAFQSESLRVVVDEDLTARMVQHFERLLRASSRASPAGEVESWSNALRLADMGALAYRRMVFELP